jgi:hypothetical protein
MSKYSISLSACLVVFALVGLYFAFLGIIGPDVGTYSNVTRVEGLLGLLVAAASVGALHAGKRT